MLKKLLAMTLASAFATIALSLNVSQAKAGFGTQYVAVGVSNGTNSGCSDPGFGTDSFGSADWAVKHALMNAPKGGTVFLCPGVYDFTTGVRIRGWIEPDITISGAGRYKTTIDGGDEVQIFKVWTYVETLTVKAMTIQRAYAFEGAAICQQGDVDLIVDEVTFQNNGADAYGAAIGCTGGNSLRVTNSSFVDNTVSAHGGAIDVHQDQGAYISNSVFIGNHADRGGALGANGSDLDVVRCTFTRNSAVFTGGAIWFTEDKVSVSRSTFSGNSADYGGAIALRKGLEFQGRKILSGNRFRTNSSLNVRERDLYIGLIDEW